MKNISEGIVAGILVVIFAVGFHLGGYWSGYSKAYEKGLSKGYGMALDTVCKIIDDQIKSDTTVTKMTICSKDTITISLSRNTPLNN